MMVYIPDTDCKYIILAEKSVKQFCRDAVKEKIDRDGLKIRKVV